MPDENADFERNRWVYEVKRDAAHRAHDQHVEYHQEVNKAAISTGQLALRTSVIINGGAAVAIIAFAGAVLSQGKVPITQAGILAGSLTWFAWGALLAAVAMGAGYAANLVMSYQLASSELQYEHPYVRDGKHSKAWNRASNGIVASSIFLGLLSFLLFLIGAYDVRSTVQSLSKVDEKAQDATVEIGVLRLRLPVR